jgi:hypothetical protein
MSNQVDKYIDPPNAPEIISKMYNLSTLGDIKNLVDEIFPEWFVTVMDSYCANYPHLQQNWSKICQMIPVRPTQVMIVEELYDSTDESHTVLNAFAECFTRAGFSVRRKREYIPCSKCNKVAIPSRPLWIILKEKNIKTPLEWSSSCYNCK